MPAPQRATTIAFLTAALAVGLLAGCGGDESTTGAATTTSSAEDFPAADGQTLEQIAQGGQPSELVIAPTQSVFVEGTNRYGYGVFNVDGSPVDDADLALYAARADGGKSVGPFPATAHSLAAEAAFTSQTTSQDPDAAKLFYTSEVDFDGNGDYNLIAMIRNDDGGYSWARVVQPARVGNQKSVPRPGDEAPVINTPTADDAGGDLTKIDTRQPPSSMHDVDYADAIGKEPIVLLFATPALCASRVCGPVVDIAEEVKSERPDDAAYIHMEIWNDNDPNKGPRPQVQDFNLQTEPWLFVIDADGKVSSVIEGAFSKQELEDAIDKATGEASGAQPTTS